MCKSICEQRENQQKEKAIEELQKAIQVNENERIKLFNKVNNLQRSSTQVDFESANNIIPAMKPFTPYTVKYNGQSFLCINAVEQQEDPKQLFEEIEDYPLTPLISPIKQQQLSSQATLERIQKEAEELQKRQDFNKKWRESMNDQRMYDNIFGVLLS